MATKSKSTSSRRKTKSDLKLKTVETTQEKASANTFPRGWDEFTDFLNNATKEEMRIIGHLRMCNDPEHLMKQIRKLLAASALGVKIIPLPVKRRHPKLSMDN